MGNLMTRKDLVARGWRMTDIKALAPDAVMSNGPGRPTNLYAVEKIEKAETERKALIESGAMQAPKPIQRRQRRKTVNLNALPNIKNVKIEGQTVSVPLSLLLSLLQAQVEAPSKPVLPLRLAH